MINAILRLRRDNDYNYAKIKDTFIPANGEICLVDTARHGLRAVCGDGVSTFGQLEYIGESFIQAYYDNNTNKFYKDKLLSKEVEKKVTTSYTKKSIFTLPEMVFKEEKTKYNPISDYIESSKKEDNIIKETINNEESLIELPKIIIKEETKEEVLKEEIKEEVIQNKLPYLEYVGQAFGTYLIFQNDYGLYLLDQHAAAERINYEKYYNILGDVNQPTTSTLIPIVVSFTKSECLYIDSNLEDFSKIGFKLEPISNNDYVIREIPLWAKLDNINGIIHDILANMIDNRKVDVIYFRDSIAKQIACKSSIKANKALNKIEIDSLMEQLKSCKNPYTCPHGRPTLIKFSVNEIEKMFERIQK